ncbi:hypothetical protein RA268_29620, partial [Pseudomonas syringae pv. tagetis]
FVWWVVWLWLCFLCSLFVLCCGGLEWVLFGFCCLWLVVLGAGDVLFFCVAFFSLRCGRLGVWVFVA